MATVVRLKRRRNEDQLDVLRLAAKRQKATESTNVPLIDENVFTFAGTVASKVDGISGQVREAIRKEKLARQYKQHQSRLFGDVRQETRRQFRQNSQQNRLKVTFKHRALELNSLDNVETGNTSSNVCSRCGLLVSADRADDTKATVELKPKETTEEVKDNSGNEITDHEAVTEGTMESSSEIPDMKTVVKNVKENIKCEGSDTNKQNGDKTKTVISNHQDKKNSNVKDLSTCVCKCKDRSAANSDNILDKSNKPDNPNHPATAETKGSNAESGSTGDERVYCLVDMESDTSRQPEVSSLADQITCNSEPMVREFVSEQRDDDYVYDIYYTNSQQFDFRLFERDLVFETFNDDLMMDRAGDHDDDEFVYGDDIDDENAESNWRNDYPDEDPRIYGGDEQRYNYTNDMSEYEAFETETGDQMADWMSWRSNNDGGELSSDDEAVDPYGEGVRGTNVMYYFKRIMKKKMMEKQDHEDSEDSDTL